MKCPLTRSLLDPYADGELSRFTRWRVARHVGGCADCAQALVLVQRTRESVRAAIPHHRAPPGLVARIGVALAREAAPPPRPLARPAAPRWAAPAFAGLLLGAMLGGGIGAWRAPAEADLAQRIAVDNHRRSLLGAHLTDVQASDQHVVKPWLAARGMVSPPVRDLSAAGFELIGGRLDYLDGLPNAVVVYRRGGHIITLYVRATADLAARPMVETSRQGFHLLSWQHQGMVLLAISDIERLVLTNFANAIAAP